MRPVLFKWDANEQCMRPVARMHNIAAAQYVDGQHYMLEPVSERSMADHKHYFAWLRDAWANIPEQWGHRWPTPERLRKWALIQAGYCTVVTHHATSVAETARVLHTLTEFLDDEIEVEHIGNRILIKKAMSQSIRAMGSKIKFRDSKDKVIEVVSTLIGITPEELRRNGGKHA